MKISELLSTKLPRIAVLFGSNSPEYQVSLASAAAVLSHIDQSLYTPVPVGITREGRWFLYTGDIRRIAEDRWFSPDQCLPVSFSACGADRGILVFDPSKGEPVLLSLRAALPILHGRNGEDGTVQGLLTLCGVPVIGCGTAGSALCMDKQLAHAMASALGIRTPRSFTVYSRMEDSLPVQEAEALGYPLFVKPARAGSSFGISRVHSRDELLFALQRALKYDSKILLEEAVDGFEVGCAVMGRNTQSTEELVVGEVDEIELAEGFFDYTEKYTLKSSRIHVPARIPAELASRIKAAACKLFLGLDCDYFARIDFFLTPDGTIYFNEVNTIPGFTSHSRFPGMLKAAGYDFDRVLSMLLEMEV